MLKSLYLFSLLFTNVLFFFFLQVELFAKIKQIKIKYWTNIKYYTLPILSILNLILQTGHEFVELMTQEVMLTQETVTDSVNVSVLKQS